jgi:hypothetical protein
MATKLTKSALLKEIDFVLSDLNLLKSALQGSPHPKQQELDDYKKRFYEIINRKK